ncbi:MAG: EcsC family protein [Chitinophagaceae bacterium]
MDEYQDKALAVLLIWQKQMRRRPSFLNKLSKKVQTKINTWIPEKVHVAITATIKQMIKGVLFGAGYTTGKLAVDEPLQAREVRVQERINFYKNTAAVEGGITGAGGILLGLADFPILLGLKIKLLFDIASMYGFNIDDYKERVYLLHIFELAFSSHEHRKSIYLKMEDWDQKSNALPNDINEFNWRSFQQEYRDYIDLAKMAQLVPVIGAPVGVYVNYRLVRKLGVTAMNAYRMRLLQAQLPAS